MRLYLSAVEAGLYDAWCLHFADMDFVEVFNDSIFEHPANALVSPANSFGFMDGGIDLMISEFLGWQVQERLRDRIAEVHGSELLVGQAEMVETDANEFPLLISAPTMRMPAVLPADTVNPYLATRAALHMLSRRAARHGIDPDQSTVAFPGMGTGIGGVSHARCAWQMRRAVLDTLVDPIALPEDWDEATDRYTILQTYA